MSSVKSGEIPPRTHDKTDGRGICHPAIGRAVEIERTEPKRPTPAAGTRNASQRLWAARVELVPFPAFQPVPFYWDSSFFLNPLPNRWLLNNLELDNRLAAYRRVIDRRCACHRDGVGSRRRSGIFGAVGTAAAGA